MDIKLIVAVISFLGIAVSAGFASLGYFYRSRVDNRRSARKVLFYLLEIRHALQSSLYDASKITDEYVEKALGVFDSKGVPIRSTPLLEILVRPMIEQYIENIIDANKPEVNEKLLDQYEKALLEFAEVNPVGAYKLKGRESYEDILTHNEDYMDKCEEALFPLLEGNPFLEKMIELKEEVSSEGKADLMKEMDEFVIGLSKHCGSDDRKNCQKIIESSDEYDYSNIVVRIEKFADAMKEFIPKEELIAMEAMAGKEIEMPKEVIEKLTTLKDQMELN